MKSSAKWLLPALLLGAAVLPLSCGSTTEDPTGGETHFLTRCDTSAACGSTLACLCGVCTLPCDQRAECHGLPGGQCMLYTANNACTEAPTPGRCEVPCAADVDCRVVSALHRCDRGACRAGAAVGGAGGSGGSGGSSSGGAGLGGGGAAGGAGCERGSVSANQVVLLGDSFFAATHQAAAYLESFARNAGALPPGERYRDNSTLTSNSLALSGDGIAEQYARAVTEAPVRVVIMNGGGADVLLGSCNASDASCAVLDAAANALKDLFPRMASDGVQHVVYAFYPDPADATLRARMNTLRPLIQSACASAPLPCHFIDLRPVFAGHAEYVQGDGLNPTDAGSQAMAASIWQTMKDNCIAQ